jgi:hypothetical protein
MATDDRSLEQTTQQLLDEAEALIWGLLDENIDALDSQRLSNLMANEEVRNRYLQCVELHTDLQSLFANQSQVDQNQDDKQKNKQKNTQTKPQSPVLGSLGSFPTMPGTNVIPPLGE